MIFGGDVERLGEYIRGLKEMMGLRDWWIDLEVGEIEPEPDDPDNSDGKPVAEIDCMYGSRRALLTLTPGWEEADPDMLRMVLCHELVHAHLAFMGWIANSVHEATNRTAFRTFRAAYSSAEEVATDSIACAWAEMLPLPDDTDCDQEAA